jgi:peroxin-14
VPTQKELEEDKEKLDAQFQAGKIKKLESIVLKTFNNLLYSIVEDALKEIKEQTNTALTTVSSQSKKVDESLTSLETVLKDLEEAESKRDKDFTNVKNDIEALKELVPKVFLFLFFFEKKRDKKCKMIT